MVVYNGKDVDLAGYYKANMVQLGFFDKDGNDTGLLSVKGYYRTEAEYNIISDYESSSEFGSKDREFVRSLGYAPEDFEHSLDEIDLT